MKSIAVLSIFAMVLSGCALFAPSGSDFARQANVSGATPELVPLDPLLAELERPNTAQAAQTDLASRAETLTRTVIAPPADDDLADRGRRLRERADALRAAEI